MIELREGHLGGHEGEPHFEVSLAVAQRLRDREVVDVDGKRLGRITKCFADEDGYMTECEVRLDKGLANALGVDGDTGRIPADEVRGVDTGRIHLAIPAEQALGVAREPGESEGARGRPRKMR